MKIYVAGKWQDKEYIKQLMAQLRRMGHGITVDWTSHKYATPEVHASYAVDDIRGVKEADACIFIFERDYHYRGALVELGAALALDKVIYVVGHYEDDCIFILHPIVKRFDCADDIITSLTIEEEEPQCP